MTCIVGLKDGRDVYVGGDSAGVMGLSITTRADAKVFRNGAYVIGFAGSFRMRDVLEHIFVPPAPPSKDTERFMATDFINSMRTVFADNEVSQYVEGTVLFPGKIIVAFKSNLFVIDSDYQVGKPANGYDAIGVGEHLALGSLYSTAGYRAVERVEEALEAASHFSGGVTPPYTILKTRR